MVLFCVPRLSPCAATGLRYDDLGHEFQHSPEQPGESEAGEVCKDANPLIDRNRGFVL